MTPSAHLIKANRAIASANLLLEAGDIDGACNRAYYAMFDATHAALLWAVPHKNWGETKSHRGLISAFGKYLVKNDLVAADLGKVLNQVERMRLLADYTGEEVEHDKAAWAVGQATIFVATIERVTARPTPQLNA